MEVYALLLAYDPVNKRWVKIPVDATTERLQVDQRYVGAELLLSESVVQTVNPETGASADIDVSKYLVGELCIDVTAISGTFGTGEGLQILVKGKDETTGKYKTLYDSSVSLGGQITSTVTDWATLDPIPFRYLKVEWTLTCATLDASATFTVSLQGKS